MKERMHLSKTAIIALITLLALLLSLTVATYAWFTSNRTVSTTWVEMRSSSSDVQLLVSELGGDLFRGEEECPIVQVNNVDVEKLMPVSTVDLETFVYNQSTIEDYATQFEMLQDENYYYHGRVYLKAEGEGQSEDARLALYFDGSAVSGGPLIQNDPQYRNENDGLLLNASRLGILFDEDYDEPFIFALSEEENPDDARMRNTKLNDVVLEEGYVLTYRGNMVTAEEDPAVLLDDYTVDTGTAGAAFPEKPLLMMEINKVYQMDVFFYLEGCDPDCTDSVSFDGVDLHLAFFGVLQ